MRNYFNSIGFKLQVVFIPGLLTVSLVIFSTQMSTITKLYEDVFKNRLTNELTTVRYVLDVHRADLGGVATRTAEFRGILDALKDKDYGGVGIALQERIQAENVDYAYLIVKNEDKFEVVSRGHNIRARPGEKNDAFALNLWQAINSKPEADQEVQTGYAHLPQAEAEKEIGELLSDDDRKKLTDNLVAISSAPLSSFGESIGSLLLARNMKDNPILAERIQKLLGITNEKVREGFLLAHKQISYLSIGRAKELSGPLTLPSDFEGNIQKTVSDAKNNVLEGAFAALDSNGIVMGVTSDKSDLNKAQNAIKKSSATLVSAIVAVFLLVSVAAVRFLLRPVRSLLAAADQMSNGNYDARVHVQAQDEIGRLSKAFNEMATSIENNMKEINRQKADLVQKNEDILLINEIVQEFSRLTLVDEVRLCIGRRSCEITHSQGFVLATPLQNGKFELTFSENFPPEFSETVVTGNFAQLPKDATLTVPLEMKSEASTQASQHLVLHRPNKVFEKTELHLLHACVSAGLIALENLKKIAMQAEMETARAIQMSLFPQSELDNEACRTCSYFFSPGSVGGDWYGYVEHKDCTFLFVADATGHGASAALITAVARSAVSSVMSVQNIETEESKDDHHRKFTTADYMSHLNKMVEESGKRKVLMTAISVRIDFKANSLEICNAAHTHPFLYEAATGKVKSLMSSGYRLGYDINTNFKSKSFLYQPGDILVLCTDGVNEARNLNGDELGVKRLKDIILRHAVYGTETLMTGIKTDLMAYAQGVPLCDDVTIVIAELR
jgi:serine phosphatase RsbU (regulator of sigma subunit)/HAMP domain-containing protein